MYIWYTCVYEVVSEAEHVYSILGSHCWWFILTVSCCLIPLCPSLLGVRLPAWPIGCVVVPPRSVLAPL